MNGFEARTIPGPGQALHRAARCLSLASRAIGPNPRGNRSESCANRPKNQAEADPKRDGSIEETAQHGVGCGSEFGDVEHQNLVGASRRTASLRPEGRVSDA